MAAINGNEVYRIDKDVDKVRVNTTEKNLFIMIYVLGSGQKRR